MKLEYWKNLENKFVAFMTDWNRVSIVGDTYGSSKLLSRANVAMPIQRVGHDAGIQKTLNSVFNRM